MRLGISVAGDVVKRKKKKKEKKEKENGPPLAPGASRGLSLLCQQFS